MKKRRFNRNHCFVLILIGAALWLSDVWLQAATPSPLPDEKIIPFDGGAWRIYNGKVVQAHGRTALSGNAVLPGVMFSDGVIEVDVFFDGRIPRENIRSFTGLSFRAQSIANYEQFYIRPHKPNSPDALQYTPVFNQVSGWQLYSGEGFTAGGSIPYDRWFRVRMEVSGVSARVFMDDDPKPALVIRQLKHGAVQGFIGLMGATPGVAFFSNFKLDNSLKPEFGPVEQPPALKDVIGEWSISEPAYAGDINRENYPGDNKLKAMTWRTVSAESTGLVDLARLPGALPPLTEPLAVYAKTMIPSKTPVLHKLRFGYSDGITIFLNGTPIFRGNSAFRSRDPLFQGIIGWEDSVFLPLRKGENEILLLITENGFGWGFQCRWDFQGGEPVALFQNYRKTWETPRMLQVPESIVYDAPRNVFYVSNFTGFPQPGVEGDGCISRILPGGVIENPKWITGLNAPTGMAIYKNRLYVAERTRLAEIDIAAGKIVQKFAPDGALFLNDVAADENGDIYISDTQAHVIYRFRKGTFEVWLKDEKLSKPNGLCLDGKTLLIGSSGTGLLLRVSLKDKTMGVLSDFGRETMIDGVQVLYDKHYLVSDWGNGIIYKVDSQGRRTTWADFTDAGVNPADFAFVREKKGLLAVPVFYGNRVMAFEPQEFIID